MRSIRDFRTADCQRIERAHDHAPTVQIMVQVLCDGAWREFAALEIGCSRGLGSGGWVDGWIAGSLVRESEEHATPMLDIRERRRKRRKTEFPWIATRAAQFIDQLWHNRVTLNVRQPTCNRGIGEGNRTGSSRGKPDRSRETVSPTGHRAHSGTCGRPAQNIGLALGSRQVRGYCAGCVPVAQVRRRQRREDATAQAAWTKRQHSRSWNSGKKVLYVPAKSARGGMWEPRFHPAEYSSAC